jgi:hypothetical protein
MNRSSRPLLHQILHFYYLQFTADREREAQLLLQPALGVLPKNGLILEAPEIGAEGLTSCGEHLKGRWSSR